MSKIQLIIRHSQTDVVMIYVMTLTFDGLAYRSNLCVCQCYLMDASQKLCALEQTLLYVYTI